MVKIAYWGPPLAGKCSSLDRMEREALLRAAGLDLQLVAPFGAVTPEVREHLLEGADGVIYVADSVVGKEQENREHLEDLFERLRAQGRDPLQVPLVFQWNKRDMPVVIPVEALERELNPRGLPSLEASAAAPYGIWESVQAVLDLVAAGAQDQKHSPKP